MNHNLYNKLYLMAMIIVLLFCFYSLYHQWQNSTTEIKIILVIILFSVCLISCKKTTFLPFLGETALPQRFLNLLPTVPDGETITKTITLNEEEKGDYLVYWAAEENNTNTIPKVKEAYKDYFNSGIIKITSDTVDLIIRKPSGYRVCSGYYLQPHVHYRIVKGNMLGEIQTIFL